MNRLTTESLRSQVEGNEGAMGVAVGAQVYRACKVQPILAGLVKYLFLLHILFVAVVSDIRNYCMFLGNDLK